MKDSSGRISGSLTSVESLYVQQELGKGRN